jgi:hypothetical protein
MTLVYSGDTEGANVKLTTISLGPSTYSHGTSFSFASDFIFLS